MFDISKIKLKALKKKDWPFVKIIYEEGIATRMATFETDVLDWEEWNKEHLESCRIVSLNGDHIVGWAALSPVSGRCIYTGVAEVSVYVSTASRGKGIGKLLLQNLIKESEENNIWTLQAGIFPENKLSLSIHKNAGFREVGLREKIGQLDGVWRDVLLLERRTKLF